MQLLEGAVQNYPWGSETAIFELLGRQPTGEPAAELWLGAHPTAPARVGPEAWGLDEVIGADPVGALGEEAAAAFGELPFLFKVLAAAEPLSLQAHPSSEQARRGFAREESAGIAVDAPERSYRDRSHKPELICALTPFEALCGFRDPAATLDLLDLLECRELDPLRARLVASREADGLAAGLEWLLTREPTAAAELVTAVIRACDAPETSAWGAERATAIGLGRRYPDDAGVVTSLLLNHVRLEPGQALFLGAGTLHTYLEGAGVELMANSDNVLRGGLTTKPVDVAALLEIVDTSPVSPVVQNPETRAGLARYDSPVPEFSLWRLEVGPSTAAEVPGPTIVLCVAGTVDAGRHVLDRGTAAWIPASDEPVALSGKGTLYGAGVGAGGPTMSNAAG